MKKIILLVLVIQVVLPIYSFAGKQHDMAGIQFETLDGWSPSVKRYTITISKNNKGALLMVSKLPYPDNGVGLAQVKLQLEKTGKHFLENAVEKDLKIHEFSRGRLRGYYFTITDKEDKPGEFKFMTQGSLVGDHLLVVFTLLFHSSHDPSEEAFAMLGSMVRSKTNR